MEKIPFNRAPQSDDGAEDLPTAKFPVGIRIVDAERLIQAVRSIKEKSGLRRTQIDAVATSLSRERIDILESLYRMDPKDAEECVEMLGVHTTGHSLASYKRLRDAIEKRRFENQSYSLNTLAEDLGSPVGTVRTYIWRNIGSGAAKKLDITELATPSKPRAKPAVKASAEKRREDRINIAFETAIQELARADVPITPANISATIKWIRAFTPLMVQTFLHQNPTFIEDTLKKIQNNE